MTFTALQRFLLCSKAHCPLVCKHWRGCDPALSAAEAQDERERLQAVQELFNYDWDIFPKHIAVSMEQLSYQALREAGLVLKRTDLPSAERSHLLHILKMAPESCPREEMVSPFGTRSQASPSSAQSSLPTISRT